MLLLGGMLIGVGVVLALIAAMLFGAAIADGSSNETLRPRGENRATANGGEGSRPG